MGGSKRMREQEKTVMRGWGKRRRRRKGMSERRQAGGKNSLPQLVDLGNPAISWAARKQRQMSHVSPSLVRSLHPSSSLLFLTCSLSSRAAAAFLCLPRSFVLPYLLTSTFTTVSLASIQGLSCFRGVRSGSSTARLAVLSGLVSCLRAWCQPIDPPAALQLMGRRLPACTD